MLLLTEECLIESDLFLAFDEWIPVVNKCVIYAKLSHLTSNETNYTHNHLLFYETNSTCHSCKYSEEIHIGMIIV